MKRVHILFVVTVCLLAAPVFALPANSAEEKETETPKSTETISESNQKNSNENEVNGELGPEIPKEETDQKPDPEEKPADEEKPTEEAPIDEKPVDGSDENADTDETSVFQGQSSGVIYFFDDEKESKCSSDPSQDGINCPAGTRSCTFSSNYTNKTIAKVSYQCLSADGKVLHKETKDEPVNFSRVSDIFNQFREFIQNMFSFPMRMTWP